MRPSSTARRYAEAAFDVARQDGEADRWLIDLRGVQDLLERPLVRQYFDEPNVSREEKVETLPRIFPNVPEHVLNLLRILTIKHRMHLVPAITDELERLMREARGLTEATVTVARPISLMPINDCSRSTSDGVIWSRRSACIIRLMSSFSAVSVWPSW